MYWRLCTIFAFALINNSLKAQLTDTVFVYDTIYVYDTIFIYDTIYVYDTIKTVESLPSIKRIENIPLHIGTQHTPEGIVVPTEKKAKTTPQKNPIINENTKKVNSMKKGSFGRVGLWRNNNSFMSQTDIGFNAGTGGLFDNDFPIFILPEIKTGFFVHHHIIQDKLKIGVDLNYGFLIGNKKYKYETIYSGNSKLLNQLFRSNYHHVSLPVYLMLDRYKLKPFAGVFISTSISTKKRELYIPDDPSDSKHSVILLNYGPYFGLNYKLRDKLHIGFSSSIGYNCSPLVIRKKDGFKFPDHYGVYINQVNFNVSYTLLQKARGKLKHKK